ncbi:MAG: RsmD family RNA methyltransferase, partial [Candidatus Saccharimonadales bacterium]
VISANLAQLKLASQIRLVKTSAGAWLKSRPDDLFDIILADPPYDNLQPNLIYELTTRLTGAGIMVLSWPGKQLAPDFNGLQIAAAKNYGDAQLIFYSR